MKIEETNNLIVGIINDENDFNIAHHFLKNKFQDQKAIRIEKDNQVNYFIYDKNMLLNKKGKIELDANGFETEHKEFSGNDIQLFHIKYENYPNGETKWERHYDEKGNLLSEEFYEEE